MTKKWIADNAGWIVIVLAVFGLAVWVLTGDSEHAEERSASRPDAAVTVALSTRHAEPVERLLTLQGAVEPHQVVDVRARTAGQVVETPLSEGATVEPGELVARLAMDDREARLREAEAAARQARSDYQAAMRLADQGFQARLAAEQAEAALEAARARVAAIELDIARTRIEAPIGGILDRLIARPGDVIAAGDPVVEIVENDPLRAVVSIPQHRVHEAREGQTARVVFLDGEQRVGRLEYVSVMADPQTRTFRARISVPNPERDLPAGTSVTVEIPVDKVPAHAVSPALIGQDEDGRLGVKVAVETGQGVRARFLPVEPVRADASRIWVTGLPETVRLITLGHGFVRDGDPIEVAGDSP
ncbi:MULTISPECIES: efflux RND transporter periplasmic adaptor subunit [unclassified Guyparkeria]|uniref:efflux RND transporter periplasmic adaptor subunit n=1 Tax=unclassified Guyparkeria TaxID=2626246 RepID=UPI001E2E9409|nr:MULTISPECIES: efflux RND transporter periplasmic adaptor subunit [unclassified Guyparkeria]